VLIFKKIVNYIGFYIIWFVDILYATHGRPWLGLIAAVIFSILTIIWENYQRTQYLFLLLGCVIAFVTESTLLFFGIYHPLAPNPWTPFCPPWMLALWLLLLLAIPSSLSWLTKYRGLPATIGLLVPLAYYSGIKLSAITFPNPLI